LSSLDLGSSFFPPLASIKLLRSIIPSSSRRLATGAEHLAIELAFKDEDGDLTANRQPLSSAAEHRLRTGGGVRRGRPGRLRYRTLKRRREEAPGRRLQRDPSRPGREKSRERSLSRSLGVAAAQQQQQKVCWPAPRSSSMSPDAGPGADDVGGQLRRGWRPTAAAAATVAATGEQQQLGTLTFSSPLRQGQADAAGNGDSLRRLPSRDPQAPGAADPYVKLQLLPRTATKRVVLRRTCSPVYERPSASTGQAGPDARHQLHFVVLSFSTASRATRSRQVLFPLGDMDPQDDRFSITREIQPRSSRIRNQNRGELLVSLCYQPAASRLTAVVLKAGTCRRWTSPDWQLYLLYNGQRIAKKKTTVKKAHAEPVYNESFVFEVPPNEGLHQLSLELLVLDWDRVTRTK
uniref:C2 domain-containing protein n=1 Tax=Macrostomum lignano TaxID=282301 RepID=A0A1I8FI28_9PLAT